jgi:type III restriction enzyme
MATTTIDKLIINSPYQEPTRYWQYDRDSRTFSLIEGKRRPAGYVIASEHSRSFDDPGIFREIPLVNVIRPRVKAWREAGYPGVTAITKRLLDHWYDPEQREDRRFFFCQLEAIETLIWLTEAPDAEKVGIDIPQEGGSLQRVCAKMATGSGKTIVMSMMIAWHVINKFTNPQDARFSKHVFVVAPGLTVRSRLAVLEPSGSGNYYEEFNVVPPALMDKLRQGKVKIRNWHALNWESAERIAKKRGVDKRGAKSDDAYVRQVLGREMESARNILVINDEAHHAWRVPAGSKIEGVSKEEIEEATKWIGGLDRINRTRNILGCYDFSATPFVPSGKKSSEEALFEWVVSDFGLNDAIESGLVKTPRVVVRDDGLPDVKTYKSKLYHIYDSVKDDLNRKAQEHEPLPDLVTNGYYLLGRDWLETAKAWEQAGFKTPPVLISVVNRTETAARVKYAFDHKKIRIDELCIPALTLHIDSKVLEMAEAQEEAVETALVAKDDENANGEGEEVDVDETPSRRLTKKEAAEVLRETVDTVGRAGRLGERIRSVISVGMLSEGWDAKTVTHIMGLRAFSSQLLCEQVVGRGLRRTSYEVNPATGLFEAEYVNIFGVPFTFLPHEGGEGPPPPPPAPKTCIEPVAEKAQFEIRFPNIVRIDHLYKPTLRLDMDAVKPLELNAAETATIAQLSPVISGKPVEKIIAEIGLDKLAEEFRTQKIVFETARDIYDQMQPTWTGSREFLLAQLIRLVEQFMASGRIRITPALFNQDDARRRILITLNMNKVVQHIWEAIRFANTEMTVPVFDTDNPIRSSADMRPWYSGKPCVYTERSHVNYCVADSTWEATEAFALDHHANVDAWVKNDHLGFEIHYMFQGAVHKFRPDFIVRLRSGEMLVIEVKGRDSQQDQTKREFLREWVDAVNQHKGFGKWRSAAVFNAKEIAGLL